MAKLTILVGAPGAGKTTFSYTLDGKRVSTDEIRKEVLGGESIEYSEDVANQLLSASGISLYGFTEEQLTEIKHRACVDYVFYLARKQCRDLLKNGQDVIYDSTNFKKKYRQQILDEAKGSYSQCDVYFFDIPQEALLERNNSRERKEPESVIKQIHSSIEKPTYSEGYENIFIVDRDGNITLMKREDV